MSPSGRGGLIPLTLDLIAFTWIAISLAPPATGAATPSALPTVAAPPDVTQMADIHPVTPARQPPPGDGTTRTAVITIDRAIGIHLLARRQPDQPHRTTGTARATAIARTAPSGPLSRLSLARGARTNSAGRALGLADAVVRRSGFERAGLQVDELVPGPAAFLCPRRDVRERREAHVHMALGGDGGD